MDILLYFLQPQNKLLLNYLNEASVKRQRPHFKSMEYVEA